MISREHRIDPESTHEHETWAVCKIITTLSEDVIFRNNSYIIKDVHLRSIGILM